MILKQIIYIFSIATTIVLFISCENSEPKSEPVPTLDGYWDNGDMIVNINGSNGVIFEIKRGDWLKAQEAGFVNIGSLRFRFITSLDSSNAAGEYFSGQELWYRLTPMHEIEQVNWSETGDFNLRNEGNTLYVSTKDPWSNFWATQEYTKVDL